jgi:hypothetical protein
MRLIGAGLPRSGTLSQKVALEMLGFAPCYHMVNVLADLDQASLWGRALEGEQPWGEIFDSFQATVDWPGSYFWRELAERYPDAKVLLSVRDAEGWERSMRETIWGIFYGEILIKDLSSARCRVDPSWRGYIELMERMWQQSGLIDSGARTTSESMRRAMERFNEEVKDGIDPDRLLVWSVQDGWEPLCEFLELPVPEIPFPHLNDSQEFIGRIVDGALLSIQQWRNQNPATLTAAQH